MIASERIETRILLIRGRRVMLDTDLASLYRVSTKRLNEQVKRNPNRFPADFMFRLTAKEKAEVVAKCDHLGRLKFSPALPYAFTEHGAMMLASVLNTPVAARARSSPFCFPFHPICLTVSTSCPARSLAKRSSTHSSSRIFT
jgi:hypothetical protein